MTNFRQKKEWFKKSIFNPSTKWHWSNKIWSLGKGILGQKMDMVFSIKDFAYITINFYEFLSWNTENVYYLPSWKRGRGGNGKSSQQCFVGRTVLLHTFYSSRSDSNPVAWDGPPNVGIDTSICSDYKQWDFFSSNKICSLLIRLPRAFDQALFSCVCAINVTPTPKISNFSF